MRSGASRKRSQPRRPLGDSPHGVMPLGPIAVHLPPATLGSDPDVASQKRIRRPGWPFVPRAKELSSHLYPLLRPASTYSAALDGAVVKLRHRVHRLQPGFSRTLRPSERTRPVEWPPHAGLHRERHGGRRRHLELAAGRRRRIALRGGAQALHRRRSTPRCAAPGPAARPRSSSWTATAPARAGRSTRSSPRISTTGASSSSRRSGPSTRASSRTGATRRSSSACTPWPGRATAS